MIDRVLHVLFGDRKTQPQIFEDFFGPGVPPQAQTPSEDWSPPTHPLPSVRPDPEYPFKEWVSGPEARALEHKEGKPE